MLHIELAGHDPMETWASPNGWEICAWDPVSDVPNIEVDRVAVESVMGVLRSSDTHFPALHFAASATPVDGAMQILPIPAEKGRKEVAEDCKTAFTRRL